MILPRISNPQHQAPPPPPPQKGRGALSKLKDVLLPVDDLEPPVRGPHPQLGKAAPWRGILGNIGVIYWSYIGIMENKMETWGVPEP